METKIQEVHDYFRDKLINGNFEITKIKKHHINLLIDNKYPFSIWIANMDYGICTYGDMVDAFSYMNISFRVKDKLSLWRKLKPHLDLKTNKELRRDKMIEYNRLKKELNID